VYSCASAPNPSPYFLVRTRGESAAMAQTVRMKIKELDPLRAVYDVAPLDDRIGETFRQNRVRTMLLVIFAATALLLACVGIYGTLSYTVSLRRREIGLRLALGAVRSDIIRHFLKQGLRVVVLATACGLALSMASARLLSGLLYGVSPSDPLTLSGVIGIVLAFSSLAALMPALRASLVEPRQVLHEGG
jgi:putative ABC transport system permease protein